MEDTILRRTWAEIDLNALAHNYHAARALTGPGVKYLGVVKADAYGHGAVQVSRKLEALGADYLAVSSLDEARELRHGGIRAPILILGHTPPDMVPQLIQYDITQTVSAKAKAEEYNAEAAACGGTHQPVLFLQRLQLVAAAQQHHRGQQSHRHDHTVHHQHHRRCRGPAHQNGGGGNTHHADQYDQSFH